MLFVLTGASCSGKTEIGELCRDVDGLAVFDFDEHGVPELPSTEWRQQTLDSWIRVALEQQALGNDTLLTAPTPLGEVLASPSADQLEGIAVMLVDVDDTVRLARLERRSLTALYLDGGAGILQWAAWHREHAHNPRFAQQQLTTDAWASMKWERWTLLPPGSWRIPILDTTELSRAESAQRVRDWIAREREATASVH
jgi:hypothetical protein